MMLFFSSLVALNDPDNKTPYLDAHLFDCTSANSDLMLTAIARAWTLGLLRWDTSAIFKIPYRFEPERKVNMSCFASDTCPVKRLCISRPLKCASALDGFLKRQDVYDLQADLRPDHHFTSLHPCPNMERLSLTLCSAHVALHKLSDLEWYDLLKDFLPTARCLLTLVLRNGKITEPFVKLLENHKSLVRFRMRNVHLGSGGGLSMRFPPNLLHCSFDGRYQMCKVVLPDKLETLEMKNPFQTNPGYLQLPTSFQHLHTLILWNAVMPALCKPRFPVLRSVRLVFYANNADTSLLCLSHFRHVYTQIIKLSLQFPHIGKNPPFAVTDVLGIMPNLEVVKITGRPAELVPQLCAEKYPGLRQLICEGDSLPCPILEARQEWWERMKSLWCAIGFCIAFSRVNKGAIHYDLLIPICAFLQLPSLAKHEALVRKLGLSHLW